jgi:hypothetical protein
MDKSFLELEDHSEDDNEDIQLNPTPGYVVKTLLVSSTKSPKRAQGLKVFVNMCSDHRLPEPPEKDSKLLIAKAEQGINWSFQVVVSDEKKDVDKAGKPCAVWDCVIHPWFLVESIHDPVFKVLIIETCLETIEEKAIVELSREYTIPKMLAKGELDRPLLHKSEVAKENLTSGFEDLARQISQPIRNPSTTSEKRGDMKLHPSEPSKLSRPLIVELSSTSMEDLEDLSSSPSSYTFRILQSTLPGVLFKVIIQGATEQELSSSKLQLSTEGNELYFEDLSIALPKTITKVDAFYVRDKQRMEVFCG